MRLAINWFRIALSSDTLSLPAETFPTADAASIAMRDDDLRGVTLHRSAPDAGGNITLVALTGVNEKRPVWKARVFSVAENAHLFAHIVELSLSAHLNKRDGVHAHRTKWEVEGYKEDQGFEHPAVQLFRGITAEAQPDEDGRLGLIANWRVRGRFRVSLANAQIASRALNAPVELRVVDDDWPLAQSLKRYQGRYLGRVVRLRGKQAEVMTRAGEKTRVPVDYLYFEASPQRIRDYETSFMRNTRTISAWNRMQQLTYALTKQGKRNPSIFRDRMRAIVEFLGQGADFLICEADTFATAQITIDLQPRDLLIDSSQ